jgi:myo-inositol-1(or 4)-monophosphatase
MDSLKTLCDNLIPLVKEVGAYIRTERVTFDLESVKSKGIRDLVSYVDQTAEKMLVDRLSKILPEAGFITEEKTTDKIGTLNWVIDPLDGTTSYITGFPEYTTTIALSEGNKVLLGITYDIPRNKCYFAWDQGGAYCDTEKIKIKNNFSLKNSVIIIGIPTNIALYGEQYYHFIQHIHENTLGIRAIGSAALEMAYIAAGYADGFIEFGIHPWDIAAGYILIKEAGGKSTDFRGAENFLCSEVVSAGNIYPALYEATIRFLKQGPK